MSFAHSDGHRIIEVTATSYTIEGFCHRKMVTFNNSSPVAVAISDPATELGIGFMCSVENLGVGTVTLTPASGTIDGASSLALSQNQGAVLWCDGTNLFTERGMGSGGGSFTAGGDLSGTSSSQTVVGLEGKPLDSATVGSPSDGDVIKYDSASGKYKAAAESIGTGGGIFTASELKSSRASGTVYQNTSGHDMLVIIAWSCTGTGTATAYSDSSATPTTPVAIASNNNSYAAYVVFVVKSGDYYKLSGANVGTLSSWQEVEITKGSLTDSGDLSGSRALGTVYQNTGSDVLLVGVQISGGATSTGMVGPSNPPDVTVWKQTQIGGTAKTCFFPVLPGQYYQVSDSGSGTVAAWHEYDWSSVTGALYDASSRSLPASSSGLVSGWTNLSGYSVLAIISGYESSTGTLIVKTSATDETGATSPNSGTDTSTAYSSGGGSSNIRSGLAFVNPRDAYDAYVDGGTGTTVAWIEWTFQ